MSLLVKNQVFYEVKSLKCKENLFDNLQSYLRLECASVILGASEWMYFFFSKQNVVQLLSAKLKTRSADN